MFPGIRFHVRKPESDGRAEPGGSGNTGPWMKVVMHGYVRRFAGAAQTNGKGEDPVSKLDAAFIRAMTDETAGVSTGT